MAATISLAPPTKALHLDPIWLRLTSDQVNTVAAKFEITSTGANSAGETIALTFGSTTLTFTIAASPDNSGLQLPQRVAQTNQVYAEELAEAFSKNQILTDTFLVYAQNSGGTWKVIIQARSRSALALTVTEAAANLTATKTDGTGLYLQDNLRAFIEVYKDTGSLATDTQLGQQHAVYLSDRTATFDLSSHFADLSPTPPASSQIAAFGVGLASSMVRKYYYRYADKYGTPAVAEAMVKATGGKVFFGGTSANALTNYATATIKHITTERGGMLFRKPVGPVQPDWTFFEATAGHTQFNYLLNVTFTDGTNIVYSPPGWPLPTAQFHASPSFTLTSGEFYAITTGYAQLGIPALAEAAGKIVSHYDVSLVHAGIGTTYWTRYYKLKETCGPDGLHLLYTNGVGGMDTVWLNAPHSESVNTSYQVAKNIRTSGWTLADGDNVTYEPQVTQQWSANSGYYDDAKYLEHLRQIAVSAKAWLVDLTNTRYLPVNIRPGTVQAFDADNDLFSLPVEITSAWTDEKINL